MTSMFAAWRRRTDPERFDAYTRWSLYLILVTVPPLMAVGVVGAERPTQVVGVGYLVLTAAQVVAAVVVTRGSLLRALGGAPVPRRWVLVLAVVTVAAAVVALTGLGTDGVDPFGGRAVAVTTTLGTTLLAVAPQLRSGIVVLAAVGVAVAAGVADLDDAATLVPRIVSAFFIVASLAISFRLSAWMLGVVWEQERARTVHARLAVAEERLRFSRDLHDVVGRTLSAVALKSELAAELARRGQDGAVEQMLQVRELAQDSLKEMRGVVAGYRSADLTAELEGARSVLRSAGVHTRVIGDATGVPDPVQEALAWVVREAVTNVVRHSSATSCTIDLAVAPDGPGPDGRVARLRVTNDGVTPAPTRRPGSGLVGLTERLAAVGGELAATAVPGRFTVEAIVPLTVASTGTMDAQ
ncbi:sensor histidine kinase [Georgenia yuyongxinii]|uniref:Sensor histidine kinase n=1 Tax=Georgenia yuyongxinii TaxID=2589797 RepID=A0A5B8C794_9MICO|nr:histidine kinase [Georgenia yuyongxinii]QDC25301.1 sensor histidine kinase [Georgenia yuyongxinii]